MSRAEIHVPKALQKIHARPQACSEFFNVSETNDETTHIVAPPLGRSLCFASVCDVCKLVFLRFPLDGQGFALFCFVSLCSPPAGVWVNRPVLLCCAALCSDLLCLVFVLLRRLSSEGTARTANQCPAL
jgi:hypothetical protein